MIRKKSVQAILITLILFSILSLNLIISEEETQTEIDKAYACFETELGDNCGNTRSTKQAAFNLLAGSYSSSFQSDCKSALNKIKKSNCWGETDTSPCNIKSTALALLALEHVQADTEDYVKWLLDNKKSQTGLTWFLEIDSNNKTTCKINNQQIIIEENKKISGIPASGLIKTYNNYWFQVNNIEKNYTISCDKDFKTALIYQKPGSNVYHISSETHSALEHDSVTERVNSYCFSTSGLCDYEGTLWATLALAKAGEDISSYIPYLTSMSDKTENKKFLPSAFLYILTMSDDYYSELMGLQKSNSYWDESRNKFYDTALALLALQNINTDEVERAKRYLTSVQKESGCWQSDTAFILHATWPKNPVISGGGSSISDCESFGHYCTSIGECDYDKTLNNFYCSSSAEVCCETKQQELTCSEKAGIICDLDQECIGDRVSAYDTSDCCIGDCQAIEIETECGKAGYYCKSQCSESQEEKSVYSDSCDFGEICCANKPDEGGGSWLLIILLIILIILVILAIIFRNQLKVWIFKRKSGYKSKKQGGPPTRPQAPGFLPIPRQLIPRYPTQRPSGRPKNQGSESDKEFDDTMKKLKDMSK